MPVIKITTDDIARSKPPSEGWHLGRIAKFTEEAAATKPGKKASNNWIFEIPIIEEGDNKGRYMFARFNSQAPGMLVSSGFLGAALDTQVTEETEFNPDDLIGKELYGLVKDEVFEGKIIKKTNTFTTASKPPF